ISDSDKSTYNLENFVVNDSEKNYYCPDCKEYCYSEFHACIKYNTAVKEFKDLSEYNSKYLSFLNSLDSIKKYGFSGNFSNTEQQIRTQIDININLMEQKNKLSINMKKKLDHFRFVYWLFQIDKLG
ncbi:42662_t:CDS:2, partial [Gigaspora margarita]